MGLFEWGEKRFARGITRAMVHGYKLLKADNPKLNERDLIKLVLSTRPGVPAKELLKEMEDPNFWTMIARESLAGVIYILIRVEYLERMHGTLDKESEQTNAIFKLTMHDELQKAGIEIKSA